MLDLEGVCQRYRGRGAVLRRLDLRIAPGEPCVVTGANGSGKSTLLRVAAGATAPPVGRVRGRPAVVGYLPAPFPASSRLTVRAYLRHLGAVHGAERRVLRRSEALLEQLGFTDGPRDGTVSELSTGNAQKVGLAQALGPQPGLAVLDEPWTALDARAAEALDRCLADLSRTTVILIADYTGRGTGLPHARTMRLSEGQLHDVDDDLADTDPVTPAPRDNETVVPGPGRADPGQAPPGPRGTVRGPHAVGARRARAQRHVADRRAGPRLFDHLGPRTRAGAVRGATRVMALARYLLDDLLRAQRVLIPVLLFLAALGILVSGDHTLAPGPWTGSVLLLYPVTAWIGLSTGNAEDPAARTVTTASVGGPGRAAIATVLAALAATTPLIAASVLLPALVNPTGFPPPAMAAAALAHLAVALGGVALGTACACPLVHRLGWSFALVTVVVLSTVGATWLPPVGVAAATLSTAQPDHATATLPALGAVAGLAAGLLALATTASWAQARRA